MNTHTQPVAAPDYAAIKLRQNAAWSSGDYARIGITVQIVGEELAEAMNLKPGSSVLDVAAGNGNATLAFARRWCDVTSTDYVQSLLDKGKARAAAEALPATFQVADAEQLPFANASFDAVVSTFGVMFAPNQLQAASELMRVCQPGGKIGMANWTPGSFIGQLFKTLGKHITPAAGLASPAQWGAEAWLEAIFASSTHELTVREKHFAFRYRSPEHFLETFRAYYGPLHKAFLALDGEKQAQLAADIVTLIGQFNIATDGSMNVPSAYAEVVMVRK